MRVGVFDSGLGGLTIVEAITKNFKGAQIYYVADTKFAPYGNKTTKQILKHSIHITKYLIQKHQIDVLIVACNTATSAAINEIRKEFKDIIVIGTEPGVKPAMQNSNSKNIGVLATASTLSGAKYQKLLQELSQSHDVKIHEQACVGLVEQIEEGKIEDKKTVAMLHGWLEPMKNNNVDTIVLGCTHYPLIGEIIKEFMGANISLIETGSAIAKRLEDLTLKNGHNNNGELKIKVYYTGDINIKMIDMILENYENGGKIHIKDRDE